MFQRLSVLSALLVGVVTAGPVLAEDTHGQQLAAVLGSGSGIVNVTPTAAAAGFSAQITVNVHGTAPNTTFYLQRAPEVGRPLSHDGICQRASQLWPWEQPSSPGFPPAPVFVTFPRPLAGDLTTLSTDAEGAGDTHLAFDLPAIADGTQFDVEFRLVDSLTSPTIDLRSACFTVTVR